MAQALLIFAMSSDDIAKILLKKLIPLKNSLNLRRLRRVLFTPSATEGVKTTRSNRLKFRLIKGSSSYQMLLSLFFSFDWEMGLLLLHQNTFKRNSRYVSWREVARKHSQHLTAGQVQKLVGSLSSDIFERRTSNGSEPFCLLIYLDRGAT